MYREMGMTYWPEQVEAHLRQLVRHGAYRLPLGVWAYVHPRVVPTPPEFEVPAPAVLDAQLAMLDLGASMLGPVQW
jgi:hypothetical protein